jgi:hypothetical protein
MATATSARAPTLAAADLDNVWAEIAHVTVDVQTRQRNWQIWTTYCVNNGYSDPFLRDQQETERLQVLLSFAARCPLGVWGRGSQIKADTVASQLGTSARPTSWLDIPTHTNPDEAAPTCT